MRSEPRAVSSLYFYLFFFTPVTFLLTVDLFITVIHKSCTSVEKAQSWLEVRKAQKCLLCSATLL